MRRRIGSAAAFLFVLIIAISASAIARAAKRVALVVGNSAYNHANPLKNPKNDANAISETLKGLGFEVISGTDLDRLALEAKVRDFARAMRGAETGLFFYAGHGLQVNGQNYLVPVDAKLADEADLEFETVRVETVIAQMEREPRTSLVFLDACRDNPLARNLARSMGTRSANVGRGLARVESGVGTLIAYATQPGNVALDGDGTNSPFTTALLKHIRTPGLDVAQLMRRVRVEVIKDTSNRQVPWSNSSLTGDFFFAARAGATSVSTAQPQDGRLVALQEKLKELEARLEENAASNEPPSQDIADPVEVTRALQAELKRVGCDPGAIDGKWGRKGREALKRFNTHAGTNLPVGEPTLPAVNTVKAVKRAVCPVVEEAAVAPARTTGRGISVVSATYGGNCGARQGNMTSLLSAACNGKERCQYTIDYKIIGDPVFMCGKDYVALWKCSGASDSRTARVGPEAGYRKVITLSCR